MMKRNQNPVAHWFGSALLAASVLFGSAAVAQERPVAEAAPAGQIKDERALDLLKGMSDTLAKAQTLGLQVRSLVPFATPFGQQISLFGTSRVAMRRPDQLFVETRGELFPHNLYFNGKTVTAIGVDKRFYAQQPAAATASAERRPARPQAAPRPPAPESCQERAFPTSHGYCGR